MSCGPTIRPRYLYSDGICPECGRGEIRTQVFSANFIRNCFSACQWTPGRRSFRVRIGGGEQQLRLMRAQRARGSGSRRPEAETAFGQALGGDPEALAVITQKFYGRAAPRAKDKDAAGERIGVELVTA